MKIRFVYKDPEPVRFVIRERPYPEWLLRLVAQVTARAIAERRDY